MKVASDGTIYAVWMNDYDVMFSKSSNHGQTWTAPINFRKATGLSFTDKPEIVSKGLQAMADFAGGLTLSAEEIDKERGVVI